MKSWVLNISAIVIALGACLYSFLSSHNEAVVYIEMQEVFNQFEGTRDYMSEIETLKKKQQTVLDSLRLDFLSSINKFGENDTVSIKKKNFFISLKREFENNLQNKTSEYDSKIWMRINNLVREYGISSPYKIIQGAGGNGNIMYAENHLNITKDVILFINKKYEGE